MTNHEFQWVQNLRHRDEWLTYFPERGGFSHSDHHPIGTMQSWFAERGVTFDIHDAEGDFIRLDGEREHIQIVCKILAGDTFGVEIRVRWF